MKGSDRVAIDNLQERLAAMEAAFENAPVDSGSMYDLPPDDGNYEGLIDRFDFFEGGDPTQAYLAIRIKIVHNQYGGRIADVVHALEDADRFPRLKKDLATLGRGPGEYQLQDLTPDSPFLEGLLDTPVVIRISTGKKIDNRTGQLKRFVDLDRRLDALSSGSDVTSTADQGEFEYSGGGVPPDDIPF